MFENLFVAAKQSIKEEVVKVNVNFRFESNNKYENSEFGYFLYYDKNTKKIYFAKIASVCRFTNESELKESITSSVCGLQFKNGYLQLRFKEDIREESKDILKDVYAKSNMDKMRDRNFSIYHTFKFESFSYALPVVDKDLFKKTNLFLDLILPEYSIVPEVPGKNKNFAKIVNEDGQLFLTLTNQQMIEVDYQYLLQEKHKELYRPYFYEFLPNEYVQQKLQESEYNEEQLYEVEIISEKNKKDYQNDLLEGVLLFSASPIIQIRAYIKFLHTDQDETIQTQFNKIETFLQTQIVTTDNKTEIEQVFMEKLSVTSQTKVNYAVNIYNVGQANWIQILVYDDKGDLLSSIIYDIGIGSCLDNNLRKQITQQAASDIQNNSLFILSHWDMDHIQGVVELKREQFNTSWVAPDLPRGASNGAKRLAAFLSIDSSITAIFVNHNLNGELIVDNQFFMLGKGKGNGPSKRLGTSYTVNNNLGLILVIKTTSEKMLFPGDCEYIQFPSAFHQSYDALVVSHHGAKIKQADLTSIGFVASGSDKFAVSCVGRNREYPKQCHKNTIEALGYKVYETREFVDINKPCQKRLL